MLEVRSRLDRGGFSIDVDVRLPLEGLTVLFGPSGAGKTTLLRMIAGLEPRATGRIAIDGDVWQDTAAGRFVPCHRRGAGLVFQDARLFSHLSVRGNLLYGWKRTRPAERRFDVARIVDVLDLRSLLDRRPEGLSGGEVQRVSIGRSLLASPRALFMDEPLASLGPGHKEEILPFIERVAHELSIPILYVTHSIDEVTRLATQVVLMADGRIVASGPIEDVTAQAHRVPGAERLDATSVLVGRVVELEDGDGLTRIETAAGSMLVPRLPSTRGERVAVRVRARDVALALDAPPKTTILNALSTSVLDVRDAGPAQVYVRLDVGLWARITRRAARELGLRPGVSVIALVKAVAVEPVKGGSVD